MLPDFPVDPSAPLRDEESSVSFCTVFSGSIGSGSTGSVQGSSSIGTAVSMSAIVLMSLSLVVSGAPRISSTLLESFIVP